MLEISVLIALCKYVNWTAEEKGYPGALFAVIAVVSWFGCGIGGMMMGYESDGAEFGQFSVGAIVGYLVGVAIAGAANGMLVMALPEQQTTRQSPADDRRRQRDLEDLEYAYRRQNGGDVRAEPEIVPLTAAPPRSPTTRPRPATASAQPTWKRKW